jgi:hypothetical protein
MHRVEEIKDSDDDSDVKDNDNNYKRVKIM